MTNRDLHRLALETGASSRTISKWAKDPDSVHTLSGYALVAACSKLGIVVTRGGPGPLTTRRAEAPATSPETATDLTG